jgi:LytS/YehU family sensor histidine kinase
MINETELELKLLQAQIEPHFLFNTLSSITVLVDTDPDKAKAMMNRFSDLLRGCFHAARNRAVPISQEIELIANYLDIHKVHMGDRLSYDINIPDNILDHPIPPLLIQPLVENSIKHGLGPKIEGGEISIRGAVEGNVIIIMVVDSGIGIKEKTIGNGIGLESIRKRIQMLYNTNGRLILEENKPSGVRAIIEVPRL